MSEVLAIANYRVSSDEQLLNGSLETQEKAIQKAADRRGARIIKTWSGSVSSKAGTNVFRKDMHAMLDYCDQNKSVKFAFFNVYDRYMRSVNEGPYFEVLFQMKGVKVWYASESDAFNGDDAMAKFQRAMSAFNAESENEKRQTRSIEGHTTALNNGRYTFPPKLGYMRGSISGIHEPNPKISPTLSDAMKRIATLHITPQQGMKEVNDVLVMIGRSPLKMDKWRKVLCDPYYAGVVEMDRQIKVRNEDGLHTPLISMEIHLRLLGIINSRRKTQSGPMRGGNPRYPLNNRVKCTICSDAGIKNGKVVGFPIKHRYEKYRCRGCKRYMSREELHYQIEARFKERPVTPATRSIVIKALQAAWRRQEKTLTDKVAAVKRKIESLDKAVTAQAIEAIKPENALIKPELMKDIATKKQLITDSQTELAGLQNKSTADKTRFLKFALTFIENMGQRFLEVSTENRLRLELLLFPGGFFVNEDKKVLTPEISPFYRLLTNKKDLPKLEKSLMVRVKRL